MYSKRSAAQLGNIWISVTDVICSTQLPSCICTVGSQRWLYARPYLGWFLACTVVPHFNWTRVEEVTPHTSVYDCFGPSWASSVLRRCRLMTQESYARKHTHTLPHANKHFLRFSTSCEQCRGTSITNAPVAWSPRSELLVLEHKATNYHGRTNRRSHQ